MKNSSECGLWVVNNGFGCAIGQTFRTIGAVLPINGGTTSDGEMIGVALLDERLRQTQLEQGNMMENEKWVLQNVGRLRK